MKKMMTLVLALCLALTALPVLAEEAATVPAFTLTDGFSVGMTQDELVAALGATPYEIDSETTPGGTYTKFDVDRQNLNGTIADVDYLLSNGVVVAIKVDLEHNSGMAEELRTKLTETYGAAANVDLVKLGTSIYAVDDDGVLENKAEAWIAGDVMVIMETDKDGDVDLTIVQMPAQ